MDVSCTTCKQTTIITDPSDEGWFYDLKATYAFTDEGERYVAKQEGSRVIHWKCNSVVPTDDNPNALCGAANTVTEDWSATSA